MYYYEEEVPVGLKNTQIYLVFEEKWNTDLTFEVTFKNFDGTILKTEIVPYGGSATAPPDPVNVPYVFIGWDTDFSVVLNDLVVTAIFELPPIDVSPKVINVISSASGEKTFTLLSGTASGEFTLETTTVGTRNQIRDPETTINLVASTQGELTFKFIQRPASGTINLAASAAGTKNPDGDANTTISIVGTASGLKTFKFLDEDASTTIGVIGAAQGLQTAKFLEGTASTTVNTLTSSVGQQQLVTATFDSAGGSPTFSPITVAPGTTIQSPGTPSRTGFTFDGWSPSLPRQIFTNTTFTAQWTPIVYTITYVMNGGTNNPSNPSSYTIETPTITLLDPTRSGFFFTEWTPTNTIPQGSIGNKTFTAN